MACHMFLGYSPTINGLSYVPKSKVAHSLTQWQGHLLSCQILVWTAKNYTRNLWNSTQLISPVSLYISQSASTSPDVLVQNAMINVCLTTNDAVVSHLKTSRTTNLTLCSPRFTQQDPLLGCKEAAALIYIPWQAANCLKHQTTQYCLLFDLNILNKFSQENPLFSFSLSSLTHCHSHSITFIIVLGKASTIYIIYSQLDQDVGGWVKYNNLWLFYM